jgi:Abnormal spindle-like microcephaly-assoc'd, ASPM-SPD-2-Hydin
MELPQAMFRSLLWTTAIAILLVIAPLARAFDGTTSKPTSSSIRTDRTVILRPANLGFGNVVVGRRKVQTVTITNVSATDTTLLQVDTQGRDFAVNGLDLPLTLASGQSFTFTCVFAPRSRGDRRGSISFFSDAADVSTPVLRSEMTGTGVIGVADNGLTVDPAAMNFGTVQVGSSASQGGTLAAADTEVTIFSAVSSDPQFTINGLTFPVTIPPWGSQGFTVTFTPQASGPAAANLSFMNVSATVPLALESLNGVGTLSQGHSVDLSWNASTSENIIGYNIYRGTTSGGPYSKINAVLDPSTVYTDTSVADGTTYYYVTTAVNSSNGESVYSNQAQATIPGFRR